MTLLTVGEFREHAPSTLVDAAIQRILDAAEAEITAYAGPVGSAVTERVRAGGSTLVVSRRVSAVTSITETRWSTDTLLATNDWRLRSSYVIERLRTGTNPAGTGPGEVAVVYTPEDDTAVRKMVQVELSKIDIATNPGLASQTIGSWTEQYIQPGQSDPVEQRRLALGRLREPGMAVV
jgi:hypothetical protein